MSLLSRFFYRRPPDGLLEFVDRIYVFDSCFSTEALLDGMYQIYLHEIITELHEEFPDSSFFAFNFREGEKRSQFAEILCEYDVTVMDYPRQYEGCPILPVSLVQHFLRVCESWLSLGNQQNVILLHCERGGWPLLGFLLASFLIYRRLHSGERKTLEMVHREAPKGFLQLLSPLNPLPSQLRYVQYVARRNIAPEWPPPERALSLDCVILRAIPSFDSHNGCRPMIRIFGRNFLSKGGLSTQMLYSMHKKKKSLRHYRQAECDVIKIDIQCLVQGDVVLECVHLDLNPQREVMMFRIMFNTAFIRSNILMLNAENLDILWDSKERYPKGFRAEVLFGEVETISPPKAPTTVLNGEEKGGLPIEAFSRVQELFSGVEWLDSGEDAAVWLLKQLSVLNDVKELSRLQGKSSWYSSPADSEDENNESSTADSSDEAFEHKSSTDISKLLAPDNPHSIHLDFESDGRNNVHLTSEPPDPSTETVPLSHHALSNEYPHNSSPSSPPSPPPPHLSKISGDPSTSSTSSSANCKGPIPPPPPPPPPPFVSCKTLPPSPPTPYQSTSNQQTLLPPPPPPPPPLPPTIGSKINEVPQKLLPPPPPPPPPMPLALLNISTSYNTKPLRVARPPPPPPPPPPSTSALAHNAPRPPPMAKLPNAPPLPPPPSQGTIPLAPLRPSQAPPPPPSKSAMHPSPSPPPPPAPTRGTLPPPPPPPPPLGRGAMPPPPPPPPPPPLGRDTKPPPPPPRQGATPPPPPPPPFRIAAPPPPPPPGQGAAPPLPLVPSQGVGAPPPPPPLVSRGSNVPLPPPPTAKGKPSLASTNIGRGRGSSGTANAPKKASLKPLHWVKVTRAMKGSLWADSEKQDNQSRPPEIDISELESLFSAASASDVSSTKGAGRRGSNINKPEKVQLIDLRRAYNCEIMLSKIKIPLPDMLNAVLALDSSALDIDQVENLIKFCPTKEEMEMLKNYAGNKEMLGKCEQFFMELMKVPRVEAKLRVFAFKITFSSQVNDLRLNLNTINYAAREVKESLKLRQIMQTILTLGNALNQGTARGSAVGFKLDSLLKLSDTRARNNKMTLMHYLCKLLSEKMPELLDFGKDLVHLEAASKIQLKALAEEMQAVSKGLEKVEQELTASENDGVISAGFRKVLKNFLDIAEAEVRSLISLYTEVGRNADSLSQYFGEDPARCPFEQVTQILVVFVKMFNKSREENERQADAEKKKLEKEAMKEQRTPVNTNLKKDVH